MDSKDMSPLNASRLVEIVASDPDFNLELIQILTGDSRYRVKALRRAYHSQEWKGLADEAHALKGAALNAGAIRPAAVSSRLDRQARATSASADGGMIDELESELCAAVHMLKDYTEGRKS